MSKPTIEDWAWVEIMLVQAMLGSISENFRQVSLSYRENKWKVDVVLSSDNADDVEEIEDFIDVFGDLIESTYARITDAAYVAETHEIFVDTGPLDFDRSDMTQRLIFRKKER